MKYQLTNKDKFLLANNALSFSALGEKFNKSKQYFANLATDYYIKDGKVQTRGMTADKLEELENIGIIFPKECLRAFPSKKELEQQLLELTELNDSINKFSVDNNVQKEYLQTEINRINNELLEINSKLGI